MRDAEYFLTGYLCAAYAIVSVFFLRFWRDTGDRLFAFFAAAFALLVLQRILLAWFGPATADEMFGFYLIRLLAFVLIIVAVVDKNRGTRR